MIAWSTMWNVVTPQEENLGFVVFPARVFCSTVQLVLPVRKRSEQCSDKNTNWSFQKSVAFYGSKFSCNRTPNFHKLPNYLHEAEEDFLDDADPVRAECWIHCWACVPDGSEPLRAPRAAWQGSIPNQHDACPAASRILRANISLDVAAVQSLASVRSLTSLLTSDDRMSWAFMGAFFIQSFELAGYAFIIPAQIQPAVQEEQAGLCNSNTVGFCFQP